MLKIDFLDLCLNLNPRLEALIESGSKTPSHTLTLLKALNIDDYKVYSTETQITKLNIAIWYQNEAKTYYYSQ